MPLAYPAMIASTEVAPKLEAGIHHLNGVSVRKSSKSASKSVGQGGTRWTWRHCDAVCFDVDSTVCQDEAIDELAEFCGVGRQVAEMTKVAMNGNVTFREALTARLNLIRPSRQTLNEFVNQNPPSLTPGIVELVDALHERKVPVYLVTGGFKGIVLAVAKRLNIPESNIFANVLLFNQDGSYAGFDHHQMTSDSGGKALVCKFLKEKFGYKHLVMVGDGATDLETCPPVDGFIGFGGNVVREAVLRGSEWFVYNFDELRTALGEPKQQ